jgi:tripartite-type tricarboxylate transporter receptor subunit TctC
MPFTRRVAVGAPALLLAHRAVAQAQQGFPARPVRIVVPYTPGGAADIAARLLSERLPPAWGQPVVVENRAGADGVIGTEAIARAAPDGHTLGLVSVNHAVNVPLHRTPFDTLRDFVALTVVYSVPLVLVAAPGFPAGTPRERIVRIQQEVATILRMPEIRKVFDDAGLRPIGSTPEEFAAFIEKDYAFFTKALHDAKIEPQ